MNNMKIVLNLAEEPYLVYVGDDLAMTVGGWRINMLDPERSPDWLELIAKYKTFSGKQEWHQFNPEAYGKYRSFEKNPAPRQFSGFLEGEIHPWTESREEEDLADPENKD